MKNDVLILGGRGFLGGALLQEILNNRFSNGILDENKYTIYDNLTYDQDFYYTGVGFINGDIRDNELLLSNLKKSNVVVFLASIVGDGAGKLTPEVTQQINVERVKFVSDNFKGKIIFCSSCSLYGINDKICDESSPLAPISLYGQSKLEAENILSNHPRSLVYRFGTLFGLSNWSRIRLDLIINTLSANAYFNKKMVVLGASQFRPLLNVMDGGRAIYQQINTDNYGVFNIASLNCRIGNLAYQIQNHFPDAEIEIKEIDRADLRNYRADCTKMREILKFEPKFTIDDGILQLKTLFESGGLKDWKNPKYRNWDFLKEFQTHLNPIFPPNPKDLPPQS